MCIYIYICTCVYVYVYMHNICIYIYIYIFRCLYLRSRFGRQQSQIGSRDGSLCLETTDGVVAGDVVSGGREAVGVRGGLEVQGTLY